ncbi:MAG: polysaccharide deacetylase family protein [Chloroflexota bacterium]
MYCHYVFDDQTDNFRRIISELSSLGQFVSTDRCLAMIRGDEPIDGRYFHLSFDDGFRNVITNGLPVLKEYGVPAMLFVPTGLIDADYETVRDYCLNRTGYAGVIETVTWGDLERALEDGFDVGSHTRTHARLSDVVDEDVLEDEIAGSREDIQQKLGSDCPYISWPYGSPNDIDQRGISVVRRVGYHALFGAFRGSVQEGGATDQYFVPRHHFEVQWPVRHVKYFAKGHWE